MKNGKIKHSVLQRCNLLLAAAVLPPKDLTDVGAMVKPERTEQQLALLSAKVPSVGAKLVLLRFSLMLVEVVVAALFVILSR